MRGNLGAGRHKVGTPTALPDDRDIGAADVCPAQTSPPARGVTTTGTPADPARDRLLAYDIAPTSARRSGFIVLGLAGCIFAFALIAVIAISHFPLGDSWDQSAIDRTVELDSSSEQLGLPIPATRAGPTMPKFIVQASRGMSGEPAPLGLALQGQAEGAVVIITGLLPGMELSTGGSLGGDAWQLSATELHYAWIAPPKDFVGSADLIAELRLPSNQIADRRAIHFEWVTATSPAPARRELDRERIPQLQPDRQEITAVPPISPELTQPPLEREGVSTSPAVLPKPSPRRLNRKQITRGNDNFGIARKDGTLRAPFTDVYAGNSTNAPKGFWDWSR